MRAGSELQVKLAKLVPASSRQVSEPRSDGFVAESALTYRLDESTA